MSTFAVTVERLTIEPHPNADRLELAQVGLFRAVVPKGEFKTGDYAIYIPEQALVPDELLEELNLVGKLAGKQKNRVKAVRLRGELSQGIVCRPAAVTEMLGGRWTDAGTAKAVWAASADFASELGITKWVPEIPTQMAGKVYAAERLLRWSDIENIKRYPEMFQSGEPVVATEKVHGTCFLLTYEAEATGGERTTVSSKGYGGKGLAIEHDTGNLYWRAVEAYDLVDFADKVSIVAGAPTVGLFGEVYGEGVQDLSYGVNVRGGRPGFVLFDIAVDYGDGIQVFLSPHQFQDVVDEVNESRIPAVETAEADSVEPALVETAPVLYDGPYDEALMLQLAEGNTELGGGGVQQIREGLVVRPAKDAYSPITGGRKIGKIVSESYLTRGGSATEFE